ncbi:MAG: class I SAM-dependent methyltransferase [Bdellovibrionota bacterium]
MTQADTKTKSPESSAVASESALQALSSPELGHLNRSFQFPGSVGEASLPSGFKGGVERLKRRIRLFLLGDYFTAQLEFNAQLVRHLNAVQDRLQVALLRLEDSRDGSVYAAEQRMLARLDSLVRSMHESLGVLQRETAENKFQLETLDSVVRGMERILAQLSSQKRVHNAEAAENANSAASESAASTIGPVDYSYLLLENRYRGSEAAIAQKLSLYPDLFLGLAHPVLEIGAGRGELQRLFRDRGIQSYGIDVDQAMVERSKDAGLDVRYADALHHLRGLPDASLGGIIAVQVVEHLPYPVLKDLIAEARRTLAPGGRLVFETIFSGSIVALTQNYFRDPTHAAPIHPDTMRFLLELAGLSVREVRKLSPFPKEVLLSRIPHADFMTPRWNELLDVINRNTAQLNDLLYGFQDYCVIAEVPTK